MKLFLYYITHTFVNQFKKLFKSWFFIFFLACFLIGGVIGGVLGAFLDEVPDDPGYEDGAPPYEDVPPVEDDVPPDGDFEDEPLFPDAESAALFLDFIISAVVIAFFVFSAFAADKNGSAIFMMADVNLLFSAPMKPQSVLFFKLMTQILLMAVSSIYIIIELPVLSAALGFGVWVALAMIAAWILLCIYSKLLNVLIYTVASTYEGLKRFIRPACIVIVLITLLPIALDYAKTGDSPIASALRYLSLPFMRYIPIFGWLKGMVLYALEGRIVGAIAYLLLLIGGVVLSVFGIWRIKADFYEDAMAKSEELAAAQSAAQGGNTLKRKKDRVDSIKRDGLTHGAGANIFFFKSLYNRFRFAYFRVFTKTSIFYLMISVGLALLFRLAMNVDNFVVIGFVLGALVFFRSLGNPLAKDMEKPYFVTVPASSHEKVLWSLFAGSLDTALDTLPAILISGLLLMASPLEMLAFWVLLVAVDFYSNNVMLFIELSLPTSLAQQLKQMIVVMFIYFGLIPIAAIALISFLLIGEWLPVLAISSLGALGIGFIFYAFSPLFLTYGRK